MKVKDSISAKAKVLQSPDKKHTNKSMMSKENKIKNKEKESIKMIVESKNQTHASDINRHGAKDRNKF